MNYLFEQYSNKILSLDVSTDNTKAVNFYKSFGLQIKEIYLSVPDDVEFAQFESQIDEKGNKILSKYEHELFDYQALN